MVILKKAKLSALVSDDYRLASVFKNYGIDYYCRGERTIEEVCESKNIKSELLVNDLNNAMITANNPQMDYHSWSLDQLAHYIEEKHHSYVKNVSPMILKHLYLLCKEYGDLRPELPTIMELFTKVQKKSESHNNKQRFVLFPYIRKMDCILCDGDSIDKKYLGVMKVQMQIILQENNFEVQHFLEIRELCNNYIPQHGVSDNYCKVLELLSDFESKLELQLHLENNLLFPRALQVETYLIKNQKR